MHKEFCNSDFYSSLFRELARGRLRSVHADTTIHNHFFSDLLLHLSLSTYQIKFELVLTSVKDLVLGFCIDMQCLMVLMIRVDLWIYTAIIYVYE